MDETPRSLDQERRRRWLGVLARAEAHALETAWSTLDTKPDYDVLRAPEAGMAMVRGRAGGSGAPFNLGEMTLTRCAVRLADGTTGYGCVSGRDKRHAELVALFDALLQQPAHRGVLEREVIAPLAEGLSDRQRRRTAQAAATKVEFFTLVRGDD